MLTFPGRVCVNVKTRDRRFKVAWIRQAVGANGTQLWQLIVSPKDFLDVCDHRVSWSSGVAMHDAHPLEGPSGRSTLKRMPRGTTTSSPGLTIKLWETLCQIRASEPHTLRRTVRALSGYPVDLAEGE